jgi:hypothetical protein
MKDNDVMPAEWAIWKVMSFDGGLGLGLTVEAVRPVESGT